MTPPSSDKGLREEVARLLADHFGYRPFDRMALHKADLRQRVRIDEFDINEATQDDCLEAADAILALPALSLSRGGWRPIETAEPKEHTCILVATSDDPPVVGEARWRREDGELELWWAGTGPGDDYYADPISQTNRPVTHWRPLPDPPLSASPLPSESSQADARMGRAPSAANATPGGNKNAD